MDLKIKSSTFNHIEENWNPRKTGIASEYVSYEVSLHRSEMYGLTGSVQLESSKD